MGTGLWIGCVSNSAFVWQFYKHKVCVSKELWWVFPLLTSGRVCFWITKWWVFFLPGASIFPQEKKWYFSVILLSNVNLDHVILYVCCVFQLIVAVIYHLQSFGTQNPAYDLFLKGADVNACSETFNNSFELTMGLTGRGFPGWNFTYIPWIANRADPSTCFFQVMKVVNLKERPDSSQMALYLLL